MAEASIEPALTSKSTPRASHVAHAWLRDAVFLELTSEAIRRRQHPDVRVAAIIDRVICLGLVDEILGAPK